MEMKVASIHTRIQPSLKRRAEQIFSESGHTPSDVIEQFYIQTVRKGRIPIRLTKRRASIPNENLMTPKEIRAMLASAEKSAKGQIESGRYVTLEKVKGKLKEDYGLKL